MKPPLIPPTPRHINLKPTGPVSLLTAFAEEQWTNSANLARQRYRTTKDPYYLAVEIAAKSQSDNVADRSAGKVAVESMIKDNITITDVDTLDLYEFACARTDINYSETIGVLRARLVKALPKDQKSCSRCFDACVWNSDWKNAQQIAASLNKNFASDRKSLFQYILATHQYSLSDECPEGSRKIFTALAKAQADKAFDLRAVAPDNDQHADRAVGSESEAWLWLNIRISSCTPKENLELFRKPEYSPLAFLKAGHQEPYWIALNYLQTYRAWDDVFQIGKEIFEEATRIAQKEATAIENDEKITSLRKLAETDDKQGSSVKKDLARAIEKARPPRTLKDQSYISASCEYGLFIATFTAAKAQPDRKRALKQVRQLVDKLIKALTRAESMRPIFQKTYDILSLSILVARESPANLDSHGYTTRVANFMNHVVRHYDDPNCAAEALTLIPELTKQEVTSFIAALRAATIKCDDTYKRFILTSLSLRIRYAVAMGSIFTCTICNARMERSGCVPCLKSIAINTLDAYKAGMENDDYRQKILSGQSQNPFSDMAVIGAVCLLRLAGLATESHPMGTNSLYHANIQLFLQALIWLDSCLVMLPSVSNTHRVLLVKLYLLMGCVSRAKAYWDRFAVKNALLDSLGLLFIDRISSIAPGLFIAGSSRDNPVQPFMVHFTRGLMSTTPKKIMEALEMGTYSSIQEMIRYAEKQTSSCTLVMAVVEERRGLRIKTGKIEVPIEDQPLVRKITTDHTIRDITDYGIFSVPDSESAQPLSSLVHYGPLPTGGRAHAGLIAERFLDLVCYVQPKEYKPSKASQVAQLDWKYASATSSHLEKEMRTILALGDKGLQEGEKVDVGKLRDSVRGSYTTPEYWYYGIIWRLANAVKSILAHGFLSTSTNETREFDRFLIRGIIKSLEDQTQDFLEVPENIHSKIYAFHGFAALHAMGMLRESILAVKYTTNYLTSISEKLKNTDKARANTELAWLAAELKKMTAAAAESENKIKARIKLLRDYLSNVDGWRDRLCDWVFGDYTTAYDEDAEFKQEVASKIKAVIPKANGELWADKVGESWRELMNGWAAVRFD
ncbi:N-acetyltransferase B complex non catalytic subunit-domain-containing protein [Daldinia caldariorum]|uniref:N-acetyltransferase B complex non catalytic subunit-domain-containing protein n=1 Tax=Daldinia caldariorum TaxID=326644 RepID=UPI0020086237|nr:N-acetyltransferase B complex non catalytic subunit-domain-containing protein [Daldinia caldariorum]KAI1465594.1 N-acetyltransferase B complex non catalytic subunit-domain-containing protein [Daldinia caldariorum]